MRRMPVIPHDNRAEASASPKHLRVIVTLAVCYAFAMLDRQILAIIAGPLKDDLGIDDFELGLLLGPAFAGSYILLSIPMGWLSDRWSRTKVIATGLAVWTVGTIASGFVSTFAALFAARTVTGAGESTLVPSSHAIISERIPREKLSKALAIFGWGASLGIGLSSILGGIALQWLESGGSIPFLGDREPWQSVFILAGLPGIVITFLVLRIRETKSTKTKDEAREAREEAPLKPFLKKRWIFLTCHLLAFGINNLLVYTVLVWTLPFIERNFDYSIAFAGTVFGIATIAGPVLGSLAFGHLVDRLYARGMRDAHLKVFLIAVSVGNPLLAAGYWLALDWLFWTGLAVHLLTLNAYFAVGAAALQIVTPNALRARMSASLVAFVNIMGAIVGPPVIGAIIVYVFRDPARVGDALALMIMAGMFAILPLAWIAGRQMRAIGAEQDAAEQTSAI